MDEEYPTEFTIFVLLNEQGDVRRFPVSLWTYTNQINKNHGLSERPNFAELATHKLYPVERVPFPELDTSVYHVVSVDPELVNGKWIQRYQVTQRPFKDVADFQRSKRNGLLIECDWTQVSDAPVDRPAWAAYRQLLRDISEQPDFPYTITWPTPPEN